MNRLIRWRTIAIGAVSNSLLQTSPRLAQILDRASERIGRRIFLLSDEPYRRIRFDHGDFVSPAQVYPWMVVRF